MARVYFPVIFKPHHYDVSMAGVNVDIDSHVEYMLADAVELEASVVFQALPV